MLRGGGFLAIWHDIEASAEDEYNQWHTQQHMPERLGILGFLNGRRLVDWRRTRYRYFTLYEGVDLEVFESEAYLERLNHPTPWSVRMQPAFRNFVRCACAVHHCTGIGTGGAMATIGVKGCSDGFAGLVRGAIEDAASAGGVTGTAVGTTRPEITGVPTKETVLRAGSEEPGFDAVILIEGIGREPVARAARQAADRLAALEPTARVELAIYDLAYMLSSGMDRP